MGKINLTLANPKAEQINREGNLIPIALVLILGLSLLIYQPWLKSSAPPGSQLLSQNNLEMEYGLKVRLIGVTGGGGLVDLRLKMIDSEKARQFLQNPNHLPISLITTDGTQVLAADGMDEDIRWENGEILFMLLPNSEGLIQPGSPIIVQFGDIKLEPIPAQ